VPVRGRPLAAIARGALDVRALRERFYVLPKLSTLVGRFRPWTLDHFAAMFSYLVVGNVVFLVVGTTTFASLIVWVANTLQFQGTSRRRAPPQPVAGPRGGWHSTGTHTHALP
jgi:hypothetical protein